MKRLVVGIIALAVLVSTTRQVTAQAKTLMSEMRVETAIIEAIDAATRTITLKKPDGTFVSTVAGPDVKRFAELKVGDKVTARYYENVVVRLKRPGESDVASATKAHDARRAGPAGWHEGEAGDGHGHDYVDQHGRAVDHVHRAQRLRVHIQSGDKAALANVKVGDKFDIVWTEAMLVSIEAGK